jgi:serine/threonine protein kinase
VNEGGSVWFNRYEVIEELGVGGMATVFLARDLQLERRVALKLLRTCEPEFAQRLFREARITARCQHDNVVVIYEVGEQNGWPYIVLEHLCGKPLTALLEITARLPYTRAVEILVPVLGALQHIHDAGVVHRDLKPDNIFMTETGMPKLLDFGIAKVVHRSPRVLPEGVIASSAELTRAGMIVGTYEYMSPEQWGIGVEIDHLSDIWACGVLLYRMICGRHPLHPREGAQLLVTAMLDSPMPSMSEAAPPGVPRELIAVVDRCLLKSKDRRWQSAADLLAALLPFLPGRAREDNVGRQSDATTLILKIEPINAPVATQSHDDSVRSMSTDVQPPFSLVGESAVAHPVNSAKSQQGAQIISKHHDSVAKQQATIKPAQTRKNTILFLAADPTGTDQYTLGRQAHDIREELERSGWRDRFELITWWAPEPMDLLRALRTKPTVVHFAGSGKQAPDHRWGQALVGDKVSGLFLRGRDGRPQLVGPGALGETFGAAGASVRLVVMSASYSGPQAEALLQHVDCVVGLRGTHPETAKVYSIGFYGGLGDYESVVTAHKQGCAAISLMGLQDDDRPQLKVRAGVDASKLILAAAASSQRDRR